MKIPIDSKFLATTIVTFLIIIVAVVILNKFAGTAVATVVGSVLGGIVLKLFDKLDYSPTSSVNISNNTSQIISILSGIFILYGCTIFAKISNNASIIIYGEDYICNPLTIILNIVFGWGGIII